jgi:hypothetical protein
MLVKTRVLSVQEKLERMQNELKKLQEIPLDLHESSIFSRLLICLLVADAIHGISSNVIWGKRD